MMKKQVAGEKEYEKEKENRKDGITWMEGTKETDERKE